jgi:O-antigen ligase
MLVHNNSDVAIRISHIQLLGHGRDLVVNGDFNAGSDRWILISDFEHLSWHLKNLYLQIFFEGGTIWLAVFLLVFGVAIVRAIRSAHARIPLGPGIAGALGGFAVVGLTGSLLDNPRPAFLFYVVLMWALRSVSPVRAHAHGA